MLVEFSVGNYRSFKETVTLSMVAAHLTSKDKNLDENNVFIENNLSLLKSAAVYGANASGKSNLAKALEFMRWFMVNSSKETQSTEKIEVEPFELSTQTESQPTFFEIVFIMGGSRYRYGFEVTREEVVSEWLFYVPQSRETKLFERKNNRFYVSKKYEAEGIQNKTRHNALFLSVSAQFNVKIAENILDWTSSKLKVISGLEDRGYRNYTVHCLVENENRDEILELLKKLDLGFSDVKVEEHEFTSDILPKEMPDEIKNSIVKNGKVKLTSVQTIHRKFDEKGNFIAMESFDFVDHESEGTQKVFSLAAPLVDTLKDGKTLIIDEFDARLHPLISRAIVQLFNSNKTNPNNAQLIFMTHGTNLLSNKLFRRDQIWFTEKDRYGVTHLYSLAEYKVRNDASFESDYIKGKYGAIPYINNLNNLIDNHA